MTWKMKSGQLRFRERRIRSEGGRAGEKKDEGRLISRGAWGCRGLVGGDGGLSDALGVCRRLAGGFSGGIWSLSGRGWSGLLRGDGVFGVDQADRSGAAGRWELTQAVGPGCKGCDMGRGGAGRSGHGRRKRSGSPSPFRISLMRLRPSASSAKRRSKVRRSRVLMVAASRPNSSNRLRAAGRHRALPRYRRTERW